MPKTSLITAVVAVVGLTACAPGAASPTPSPELATTPTAVASPESTPPVTKLSLVRAGSTTDFEPQDVFCKGTPGNLVHLIAKGPNGLPIVEVSNDFAMVKLDQRGAPEKSTVRPAGITVTDQTMSFADVKIGAVVVNGDLNCTSLTAS